MLIRLSSVGCGRGWWHCAGLCSVCVCMNEFAVALYSCEIVICDAPGGSGRIEISPREVITSGRTTNTLAAFVVFYIFCAPQNGSRCLCRTIKWKSMAGCKLRLWEKDQLDQSFSVRIKVCPQGVRSPGWILLPASVLITSSLKLQIIAVL